VTCPGPATRSPAGCTRCCGLVPGGIPDEITAAQAERILSQIRPASAAAGARCELAEDLTEHHHHLLCINCGKVTDVTLPAGFEQQITGAISKLADAENFQAHSHRLDVLGRCAACQ